MAKKIFRIIGIILAAVVATAALFLLFLTVTEYRPAKVENAAVLSSDGGKAQYYVIDGFILSPNVQMNTVKTLDEGFVNTDHNPVRLTVTLAQQR